MRIYADKYAVNSQSGVTKVCTGQFRTVLTRENRLWGGEDMLHSHLLERLDLPTSWLSRRDLECCGDQHGARRSITLPAPSGDPFTVLWMEKRGLRIEMG